jgi:hypothetical protein
VLRQAAESWIGFRIDGSSFSGFTRVEIGHIRIGSAGNGRRRSRGSGSSLSQRTLSLDERISGIRLWICATNSKQPYAVALKDGRPFGIGRLMGELEGPVLRLPLEEAVDRDDAASPAIGFPEHG